MAVKVPQTLSHLHYWSVQLTRNASKEEVLNAFRASSRIALIRASDGLAAINTVKEMMADLGRPHDNLYEVALWEDRSEEHTSELQSLMRISYAVFCLKKKTIRHASTNRL